MDKDSRKILAISHTPRGEMHIVVSLLALKFALLIQTMFISIVSGAIFSSIITGPWLATVIRNLKISQKIKIFVYNIEEVHTKEKFIKSLLEKSGNYNLESFEKIMKNKSDIEKFNQLKVDEDTKQYLEGIFNLEKIS